MSSEIQRLSFIDALRGYAILGVIAVHSSQIFSGLEFPFRIVADQGARGIQLFFVVSALTLMLSWHARNDGVLPFYVRRFFRIAPMFWLAIIYYVALNPMTPRYWGPIDISWSHILASVTFVHGLHPDAISSIVPGGWTIADEMTFYVLFPLLVWALSSWRAAAIAMLASAYFVWKINPPTTIDVLQSLFTTTSTDLVAEFSDLWLLYQFPAFIVGILVFQLLRAFSGRIPRALVWTGLVIAIVAIVGLPFFAAFRVPQIRGIFYFMLLTQLPLTYSLAFGVLAFCLAQGVGRLLVNAPIRYIGKVSYSAYFWHFQMLEVVGRALDPLDIAHASPTWPYWIAVFGAGTALTVLGSTLTFYVVEAPMIEFGRRLAAKVARRGGRPFNQPVLPVPGRAAAEPLCYPADVSKARDRGVSWRS